MIYSRFYTICTVAWLCSILIIAAFISNANWITWP